MIKQCIKIALTYCVLQALWAAELLEDLTSLSLHSSSDGSHSMVMPHAWIERSDVFNAEEDLKALLSKSKVSGVLPIKNNTSAPVSVRAFGRQGPEEIEIDLTINASEIIATLNLSSYENFILSAESFGFIDFYSIEGRFEISIESQPMLLFPRQLKPFSFTPERTSTISGFDENRQSEIKQYRGHLNFLERYVCKYEGIKFTDLFQHRETLYNTNRLEKIIETPLSSTSRIPLNLFSIWLTNPDAPVEPDLKFIEMAKESAKRNRRIDGWNYYFLVKDPSLLPQTVAALADTDIQLIAYTDLLGPLELATEFAEALAENNFGEASDILRVEALRQMGGGYLDIDLQVFQSLKPYFYFYDSVFGVEPMTEFIGNAFMACTANHPVMVALTGLIKRNCTLVREKTNSQPTRTKEEFDQIKSFYANLFAKHKSNTLFTTGPCAATVAFYQAAGKSTTDIALPPEALYPGKTLRRPEFDIPNVADSIGLSSACLHLWRKTWLR